MPQKPERKNPRTELANLTRERDAYKRAKMENDERFQLEAAEARERLQGVVALVRGFLERIRYNDHCQVCLRAVGHAEDCAAKELSEGVQKVLVGGR